MMLVAKGTRVRLIHTGETGTITELLGDDIVQVLLDSGDEIPTFVGDLTREDGEGGKVKAKIIEVPERQPIQKHDLPEAQQQYAILKSMGVQLAFLPIYHSNGSPDHFQIYLINDTQYDALFAFGLNIQNLHRPKKNGKIKSLSFQHLDDLPYVDLNNNPSFELEVWQITTEGTGKRLQKTIKLKPKQFFNSMLTAPLLNKRVHHYRVFETFDTPDKMEGLEDLKTYTKRKAKEVKTPPKESHLIPINEIENLAHFKPEIDLHAEQLTYKAAKMSAAEILRLQLQHFDEFISEAIQVGVDRVFVIHGIGKGKLRNDIATRLIKNPLVATFKNEYHHKYGFGATEVIFVDE